MDTEMTISEELQSRSIAELESRLSEVDAELVEYQALEKLVAVGLQEARLKHESSERALESLRMQVITIESQIEVRKKTHEQDKERIRVRLASVQQHLETVKEKRTQLEDDLSRETTDFDQESSALAERIGKLEKEFSEVSSVREDIINVLKDENDRAQIWAGRIQAIHTLLYGNAQPKGVKLIKQLADSNTSKFIEELAAKYGDTLSAPLPAAPPSAVTTAATTTTTTTTTTTKKASPTKVISTGTTSPTVEAGKEASSVGEIQVKKPAGKRFRSTELDTLIRDHALAGSLQHTTFQDKKQVDDVEEFCIEPIVKRTRSSNSRSSEEATGEKQSTQPRAKSKRRNEPEDEDDDDDNSLSSDDSSSASIKAVRVAVDKPAIKPAALRTTTRSEEVYKKHDSVDSKSSKKQSDSAMKSPRRSSSSVARRQASWSIDSEEIGPKNASPSLTMSSTTPVKRGRQRASSYVEDQDEDDDEDDEEEDDDDESVVDDKRRKKRSRHEETGSSSKATPTRSSGKSKERKKRTSDASSAAAASSSQKPLHWTQELKLMKKERENKDYSKVTCSECPDRSDKEDLILCDRCDQGYHLSCANLTEVPSNWFICKYCKAKSAIKIKQARRDYERRNYQARRERQLALKKGKMAQEEAKSSARSSLSKKSK